MKDSQIFQSVGHCNWYCCCCAWWRRCQSRWYNYNYVRTVAV